MSAGEDIERAHQRAARACGQLSLMLTKKRISREILVEALKGLEEASSNIKKVLTAHGGGSRVGVPPKQEGDE